MVKAHFQLQALPDDRNQYVNGDCDPNLGLHGVLAGAIERLDAEVLIDKFQHSTPSGQDNLPSKCSIMLKFHRPHRIYKKENLDYFHKQTDADYLVLLNSSPCLAGKSLQTKYALAPEFVDKVRKKIGLC